MPKYTRLVRNEAGLFQLAANGKSIETERLTGRVEVKTEPIYA